MIVSRTPLRISFVGGGTDLPEFYTQELACVLSAAINKYIYVIVKPKFDNKIRVSYSRTELVDSVDEIEHELVRECLRWTGIESGVEICTMADITSEGSGLGSSSAITVGLLNAFYAYQGKFLSQADLAAEACKIEMDVLGKHMGKQDQYGCAFGGVKAIWFFCNGKVEVYPTHVSQNQLSGLDAELMLFFTGITRQSSSILDEQAKNTTQKMDVLRAMRDQARSLIYQQNNIEYFAEHIGSAMKFNWKMKKQLASGIGTEYIDDLYEKSILAGARGCKITGAGGGGFFLVSCPIENQEKISKALGLQELPFSFDFQGTRIILGREN